jgi:hypothetical protein
MKARPASELSALPETSPRSNRRRHITSLALFISLVCSGVTSCTKTQVALSTTAIAAIVVGTTVGVTYAVKHHNHTLQGCISSNADVLKLRTSEGKVYTLKGDTAGIKAGDTASVHGSKAKKVKGGEPVFVVQKLNKDYGSCPANVASSLAPTR